MSRNRAPIALVVTCGVAAFAACAPAVRSDRDESIPVPQGATWAWAMPGGPREPYEPGTPDTAGAVERGRPRGRAGPRYGMGGNGQNIPFDNAIFAQRFRRAAETTMQAKGFHKADDPSEAQFLLIFNVPAYPGYAAYPGYGAYPPYRGSPRDVRLVVMLRQRESGEVAWRASYIMDIYDMRQMSQASVQRIADKVLRELR